MPFAAHQGSFLKCDLKTRELSANRLALDLEVPSARTDILNGRRSITAGTAVRLGRYFGNRAQFWLDVQSQYDIALSNVNAVRRSRSVCDLRTVHDRSQH
jgi:addiction module HigA family antidote